MFDDTYYLNNNGDKWIVTNPQSSIRGKLDRSPMDFMLITENGEVIKRRADYFESFGNFATVSFRIKGIRYGGFFDSWIKIDGYNVIRHYSQRLTDKDREEGKEQKIVTMDNMEYKKFLELAETKKETMYIDDNDPYQIDRSIIVIAETTRSQDHRRLYLCQKQKREDRPVSS